MSTLPNRSQTNNCLYVKCPIDGAVCISWYLCNPSSLLLAADWRACLYRSGNAAGEHRLRRLQCFSWLEIMWVLFFYMSIKSLKCVLKIWEGPHNSCKPCQPFLHIRCVMMCMDTAQGWIWCHHSHNEDFASYHSSAAQKIDHLSKLLDCAF